MLLLPNTGWRVGRVGRVGRGSKVRDLQQPVSLRVLISGDYTAENLIGTGLKNGP